MKGVVKKGEVVKIGTLNVRGMNEVQYIRDVNLQKCLMKLELTRRGY